MQFGIRQYIAVQDTALFLSIALGIRVGAQQGGQNIRTRLTRLDTCLGVIHDFTSQVEKHARGASKSTR